VCDSRDMDADTREELQAVVAARRELGPEHEDHLIHAFLERIEKEIDRRVDERLATAGPRRRRGSVLHPGTLGVCIPIIAIAGGIGHLPGLIVAFAALAIVFVYAEHSR